jgi:PAS domain S-box-containing protein
MGQLGSRVGISVESEIPPGDASEPEQKATLQGGMLSSIDYRLMLDAFTDAVVVADSTHRIVYINPAAEQLLEWPAQELVGLPLTSFIPPRLHLAHREGFKRFLATHRGRIIGRPVRVPALRRDGNEIDIELNLNAMRVGDEDLIVASLRDVGDRVELERQLDVTRYLRATTRTAARLSTRLDLEQVLETVVEMLEADFDSALARIWLFDPPSNTLILSASAGLSRETSTSSRARIDLATSPYKVAEVARTREPFVRNGLLDDPQFDRDWVVSERIASTAVLPLISTGELLGVLVHFARRPLPDELVDALTAFTAIVTATINDIQLFAREQTARVEAEDQRQKLQTILNMLPMGVLLAEGQDGRLTVVNPAGQEVWGEAIASCTLSELDTVFPVTSMEGRRYEPGEHPLQRAMQQNQRVHEMLRYRRPDGQDGVLDVTAAPFPGPRGGAVATFRDVTNRLRMELELSERAAQFKALLDHLPVGVAYFDYNCVCRASNGPALRILGRSRNEITGASADDLFAQAPELRAAVARCVRDQTSHAEQAKPWPEPLGSEGLRYLDWRFEPLPATARGQTGALALIVDVTDRKCAEDELKVAKEAAEQTARNKSRFLSAVSHDLRTPVNALSLLAELLLHITRRHDDPEGELTHTAHDIRQAAANLIELINDLLDLARFDSGDVAHRPSEFSLEEWLDGTLEPLLLTAHSKNLELTWSVDQPGRVLRTDRVKLSRVLMNLVGNAIKFTERGVVTINAGRTADGWLSLAVHDTGPGIPDDQRERIFDEFAQLRNSERDRNKGTGLGLAICKRLVEAAGGRLMVESSLGSSSTFTALYPAEHIQESSRTVMPAPLESGSSSRPGTQRCVATKAPLLIVEDDSRSRQALARLLEHSSYSVELASDGPSALAILERLRPALILLDLMLPGMDGVEVLRRVRGMPDLQDLPVVLLSGDILHAHLDDLVNLGVAETLAKPVDFEALLNVIARHVEPDPATS